MLHRPRNHEATRHLSQRAETYLRKLCLEIDSRAVGSAGNRAATAFFADTIRACGFTVETPEFECMDWRGDGAELTIGDLHFEAHPSPYALGCNVNGPLVVASSVAALERADLTNTVLLLRGDIASQQLMPKSFTFYNPDEHKHIIALLEAKQPLAIVAATLRDPQMVGSQYPFPLIEDGDFDIPSVFMTDVEGDRLAAREGENVMLRSRAARLPSSGCNVIARKGADPRRRVVLFAHIDSKQGTPGALDNASGVIVLLLLAELLAHYAGSLTVELVALNGEDYYSNPGEHLYLALNAGRFDEIALGINIDGVGYRKGSVAFSLYECPAPLARLARDTFSAGEGMVEGEPWYQGDHVLFVINQRPALALTSQLASEVVAEIIHTPADSPDLIDCAKLVTVAAALKDVVTGLEPLAQ